MSMVRLRHRRLFRPCETNGLFTVRVVKPARLEPDFISTSRGEKLPAIRYSFTRTYLAIKPVPYA